jgi:hypothetical protein
MVHENMSNVEKIMQLASGDRMQYLVFVGLSLVVLGFTGVLYLSNSQLFQRFIGRINPLIPFLFAIVLGFILLSFLLSQRWFAIYEKENLKGLFRFSGLAALFGVIMILADTKIIFSADTNILFPESLLFYPAVGFLAEILFHVLPLSVLLVILNSILNNADFESIVWICILIVSLLEPIYQVMNMVSSNRYPLWAVTYVGIHVLLINFFQLLVFRKYDFISMYSFRLVYYMFWHIGWGYLRLKLLF